MTTHTLRLLLPHDLCRCACNTGRSPWPLDAIRPVDQPQKQIGNLQQPNASLLLYKTFLFLSSCPLLSLASRLVGWTVVGGCGGASLGAAATKAIQLQSRTRTRQRQLQARRSAKMADGRPASPCTSPPCATHATRRAVCIAALHIPPRVSQRGTRSGGARLVT